MEVPENNKDQITYYTLSIDIGDNEQRNLTISSDTAPEHTAYNFCRDNNLDFESLSMLTEKIKEILSTSKSTNFPPKPSRQKVKKENSKSKEQRRNGEIANKFIIKNKSNPETKNKKIRSKSNNKPERGRSINSNKEKKSIDNKKPTSREKKKSEIKPEMNYFDQRLKSRAEKVINVTDFNTPNLIDRTNSNVKSIPSIEYYSRINSYSSRELMGNSIFLDLYYRGLKGEQNKQSKINQIKKERNKTEKEQCSFNPKINPISNSLIYKRLTNHLSCLDEKKILNYKSEMDNKRNLLKEKLKSKKEKDNDENCVFRPQINSKSKSLDKHRQLIKTSALNTEGNNESVNKRYLKLYNDKKITESRIKTLENELYDESHLFKPQVNTHYNFHLKNVPFKERLEVYNSKSKEKQQILNSRADYDEKNNVKLFNPTINYRPSNRSDGNIFNHLYSKANIYQANKDKEKEEFYNNACFQGVYTNNKTNNILTKRYEKNFKALYNLIRKDTDKILSPENLNSKALPQNIYNIMSELLNELVQEKNTLNEEEFIRVCFQLSLLLNYSDRQVFVNYNPLETKKKRYGEEDYSLFTFHPAVNQKTCFTKKRSKKYLKKD
ncbi:MAG: hypothetical protein MJ252_09990 [archaeon]|nr:hypothetical protein [archaeon]